MIIGFVLFILVIAIGVIAYNFGFIKWYFHGEKEEQWHGKEENGYIFISGSGWEPINSIKVKKFKEKQNTFNTSK